MRAYNMLYALATRTKMFDGIIYQIILVDRSRDLKNEVVILRV